jgi:hypothetical protein
VYLLSLNFPTRYKRNTVIMHLTELGGGVIRSREGEREREREDEALCVSIVLIPASTDRPPL